MKPTKLPLFVGIPTPDGRAPVMTINALKDMEGEIGRKVMPMVAQGSSIVKNRNKIVHAIQDVVPDEADTALMLWLDADIFLDYNSIPAVAKMVDHIEHNRDAHKNRIALTPGYNMSTGIPSIALEDGRHPTEQIRHLTRLAYAGLGFCLLDMPLDYQFHSGPLGEDIYFFQESLVMLFFWKGVKLWHQKLMVV